MGPKSSAHLLSAVSHEDMKKMIAAASSNCLIEKMGDLPEENQEIIFNKYDDEEDDVGVKLRVSQISHETTENSNKIEISDHAVLPNLEEAEIEKYSSVGNSGDNSRRLSE